MDKIRGERQNGCLKVRLGKKHRGLTRREFPNTAVTRTAPSSGGFKVYNRFTIDVIPGRIRNLPTSESSVFS